MPDDEAKGSITAPTQPKEVPSLETPFSERTDGLDPNIDQGLIEGTRRYFEARLERARKSRTSMNDCSGGEKG
jgi:hypothetical protein